MTYHAGIGLGLESLGLPARDPRLVCDGCGATGAVMTAKGMPKASWMERHTLNGWKTTGKGTPERKDYCQSCKAGLARKK